MNMLLRFFSIAISIATTTNSFSQTNTVSSGGNASGTNGNVSYTIGQLDYFSQTGTGGNINPGVQQPYEIYGTSNLTELGENIHLTIGPNPTLDKLYLTSNLSNEVLFFFLTDANGKILIETSKLELKTEIDLSNLPVGMYHLVVRNEALEIKTFKIIKN